MERSLTTVGLTAEFVPGITPCSPLFQRWARPGSNLVVRGICRRCFCQPAAVAAATREGGGGSPHNAPGKTERCTHRYRALRDSEIAIALSHRQVYAHCVERGQSIVMVCEDDIVFHSQIDAILEKLLTPLLGTLHDETQPVIVFLGKPNNPGLSINGSENYRLEASPGGIYSNYCYLINRRGCEVLLQHFFPIVRPEDSFKRWQIGAGHLRAWVVNPGVVGEQSVGVNLPAIYHRLSTQPDRLSGGLGDYSSPNNIRGSSSMTTEPQAPAPSLAVVALRRRLIRYRRNPQDKDRGLSHRESSKPLKNESTVNRDKLSSRGKGHYE